MISINLVNIIIVSFSYTSYGYRRIEEKVAFNDANAKCQEVFGANVASIHSDADYSDVVDICGTKACWIGGEMTDKVNLTWRWIDGSLWDYQNWGTYNGIQQGQGQTPGEYHACIASEQYAQNGPRIHDCDGLEKFYPICNEPEATENITSLSPSSERTYFTSTIYYSIAPTMYPSTLPPSEASTALLKSNESLLWILFVLCLIMTIVSVSFAAMYCRAKRSKTNLSQQDMVELDKLEDSNTNVLGSAETDEVVISLSNDTALQMVTTPPGFDYDASALLEDMYDDIMSTPSPKITRTAGSDDDGEDLKSGVSENEVIAAQPTFDYDLEGRQMTEASLYHVDGKHINTVHYN